MLIILHPARRILLYLAIAGFLFLPAPLTAQLIGGNAFLQGRFVEVGLAPYGCWGTTVDAPPGYHARSNMNVDAPLYRKLGFVADPDKDGWDVGTPNKYYGDYFLPANAWAGYGLSIGGGSWFAERNYDGSPPSGFGPMPAGSVISVTTSATAMQAVYETLLQGIRIRKIVTVPADKAYFTVRTVFINTNTIAKTGIYYCEYVNPDNDACYQDIVGDGGVNRNTLNTIVYQNPTDNKALVKAEGEKTGAYLGLGTKDCRGRVFRGPGLVSSVSAPIDVMDMYNGTNGIALSGADPAVLNNYIGLSYSLGTLAAGDSTAVTFAYILAQGDLDEALAQTEPLFVYKDSLYRSGQTILACPGQTLPVTLSNGGNLSWTWSPNTDIDQTTGLHVNITAGAAASTYTIAGTGVCGVTNLSLVVAPDIPPAPAVSSPLDYCQFAAAPALTAAGTDLLWFTGPADVTGSGTAPLPSTTLTGSQTYYVLQHSATGCSSDKAVVTVNIHAADKSTETVSICERSLPYLWHGISVTAGGDAAAVWSTPNQYGCDSVISLNLSVTTAVVPSVSIDPLNPSICAGGLVSFTAKAVNGGSSPVFQWQKNGIDVGAGSSVYTDNDLHEGDRIVCVLHSSETCASTTEAASAAAVVSVSGSYLLPSAFTPDGDGKNDCFGLHSRSDIAGLEFAVYNRKGQRIFYTRTPGDCWDGSFHGIPQPADTYVFVIRGEGACGKINQRGTVTLIR